MRKLFLLLTFLAAVFSAQPALGQSASFVKSDVVTSGNWMGVYGSDGYAIEGGNSSLPAYVTSLTPSGNFTYTWETGGSNTQDLQNGSSRIAACWCSNTNFQFTLTMTGTHQVAIYLLDWDGYNGGRAEGVQITDTSGNVLAMTQSYSSFRQGVYSVFSITGTAVIQIINQNGSSNSVASGIFFDTTTVVTPPITGNHSVILDWNASQGASSYNIYRCAPTSGPSCPAPALASTTLTMYTDSTVQAGQTYQFTVSAVNSGGESGQTLVTAFTIPSP